MLTHYSGLEVSFLPGWFGSFLTDNISRWYFADGTVFLPHSDPAVGPTLEREFGIYSAATLGC